VRIRRRAALVNMVGRCGKANLLLIATPGPVMTQITRTDDELRSISRRRPLELILVATPFLLAGAYFLYYAVTAVWEYAVAMASLGEWLAMFPGLLFLLLLAAAFGLPGLYFAASEHVYVDRRQGKVGARRQLLFLHTKGKWAIFDQALKVIARQQIRKESDHHDGTPNRTFYIVDLQLANDGVLQLSELMDKSAAKRLAKALAEFIDRPLNDRL